MDRQVRMLLGCFSAVALLVTLLLLMDFLAACGGAAEPETVVETVIETVGVEVTVVPEPTELETIVETIIETVEVEKTVPPEPTQPSPPTPSSPGVVVQQELERLASGLIVYNPPAEMTVDKPERVEARISMDVTAPITTGLKGSGTPVVESISVGYFMKVRLVGDAFDIVALSSEEQIVPAQGFSEWAWDVTPTESGTRNLCLVVTALVKAPNAEGKKDLPIIERQIRVHVNPGFVVSSFFKDNRAWIFTAVLVPLLAALGRWMWQRQKSNQQPGDPDLGGDAGPA
jgi:hypothetical protein